MHWLGYSGCALYLLLGHSPDDARFVLTGDGRQWFMPATEVAGGSKIVLGGPKYAEFEVEAGAPLVAVA